MSKLLKNNNVITIIISCIIVFILLWCSSFFRVLNKTIQNKYYEVKNNIVGLTASPHIIIVELDDKSFESIWKFPFSRDIYATFLKNLEPYDVAAIAFDILFLDPSIPENDKILSQAVSSTPNVILGSSINNKWSIQTPFEGFKQGSYTTWYLPPNVESSNNTVYSFTPQLTDISGEIYEHFTIEILRAFYKYYWYPNLNEPGIYKDTQYKFSDTISYPLASKWSKELLINFIPPENFTRISFSDVYDSSMLQTLSKSISFRDAIILIGPAADGLKDEFFTPNWVEYGVNIHANILNTLLQEEYTMYFDRKLEWVLIFLLVILSVYANLSPSNKVLLISNFLIVSVFWFIFPLSILLGTNLIINFPSEIIFSLLLAFTSANIVKYLIEDTNKKKLNKALSEYVWESIADEILLEHGKVNLDGQEKNLVCLFSDIEGFTTMSEKLSPSELVSFLREYLSSMTGIIMDKRWHVDKFEWDAVMALWGAFTEHSNADYVSACNAALEQREALNALNKKWSKKLGSSVKIRMWIHGWKAIIWNIWAIGRKMEFTALGDNINLASRLESVNKYYGTYICVSEIVYIATKGFFSFRYLDEIKVKWKDIPVKIYELIWRLDAHWEKQKQIYNAFAWAMLHYKDRSFNDAKDIFERLAQDWDAPSETYTQRCEYYIQNPPGKDWDWIWRMMEK